MVSNWLVANLFACLLLVGKVLSLDLSSAPYFAFGGVNYPQLALLEPEERNEVITQLVEHNTTVIRLFIVGDETHSDVEANLGIFDERAMRRFDDTLWAIYKISKGRTKVIIAPHTVEALRGTNGYPCDGYCKKVGEAWLDFYVNQEIRARYKQRLSWMFNHYLSKNFKGATWAELKDVILGVDLQNAPFEGVHPIPVGESWICDIAEHLKERLGLGKNGIAVISGGVSGALSETGNENMPDSVWGCEAIDVIGLTGYYSSSEETSAGTHWARRFIPGSTLPARALARKKLLLVEEFSFMDWMHGMKAADIWDQAEALSFRGIPWIYSSVRNGQLKAVSEVKFRGTRKSPIWALRTALEKANKAPSKFDWSKYMKRPTLPTPHTATTPNPWKPYQNGCLFGCLGWLCDAMDGCQSDLLCKNNICQPCTSGCPGMKCDNSKALCQEPYSCVNGKCQACTSRSDLAELHGTCETTRTQCSKEFFPTTPICNFCDKRVSTCRGAPCERPSDCDSSEYCDWGICKPCKEGCLGMKCSASRTCKTGHCNEFRLCDYPPPQKKSTGNAKQPVVGRTGPCGPGQDCNKRKIGEMKPQPVLQGNMHSKGAGEKAAQAGITAGPTATA